MEWINLNDKRPESGKDVLVYFVPEGKILVSWLDDDLQWVMNDFGCGFNCVTHWMEFPKPPKE